MAYINTDIEKVIVEIEDREYPVAEKTVAIADKLEEAAKKCTGMPEYKLWLAELEILLGKAAVRELFKGGKGENIDRMHRIHAGVMRAFDHNAENLREQEAERQRELMAPLADLLRQMAAVSRMDEKKMIHRS